MAGILTTPGDTRAMADATQRLLEDATLRATMGSRAVEHATRFDWSASGDLVLNAYEQTTVPAVTVGVG